MMLAWPSGYEVDCGETVRRAVGVLGHRPVRHGSDVAGGPNEAAQRKRGGEWRAGVRIACGLATFVHPQIAWRVGPIVVFIPP